MTRMATRRPATLIEPGSVAFGIKGGLCLSGSVAVFDPGRIGIDAQLAQAAEFLQALLTTVVGFGHGLFLWAG